MPKQSCLQFLFLCCFVFRYRISSEGSLTITDTEFNDSGSYTCAPYNKIGTAGVSTATLLTVKGECMVTKYKKYKQGFSL